MYGYSTNNKLSTSVFLLREEGWAQGKVSQLSDYINLHLLLYSIVKSTLT